MSVNLSDACIRHAAEYMFSLKEENPCARIMKSINLLNLTSSIREFSIILIQCRKTQSLYSYSRSILTGSVFSENSCFNTTF